MKTIIAYCFEFFNDDRFTRARASRYNYFFRFQELGFTLTKVINAAKHKKLIPKLYICKNFRMDTEKSDDFYSRLKEELLKSNSWPADYLYKFIVPTDLKKINQIQQIFDNTGAVIESKKSSKGKYTSLSVMVNLANPDAVIEKYKEVGLIEGVISL